VLVVSCSTPHNHCVGIFFFLSQWWPNGVPTPRRTNLAMAHSPSASCRRPLSCSVVSMMRSGSIGDISMVWWTEGRRLPARTDSTLRPHRVEVCECAKCRPGHRSCGRALMSALAAHASGSLACPSMLAFAGGQNLACLSLQSWACPFCSRGLSLHWQSRRHQ